MVSFTTFGEKLKKLRTEQGLTQEQVSEYVGISRRAYIAYEQSNARPRKTETFQKLAEILRCDVNYLNDERNFVSSVENSFVEMMSAVLASALAPFPVSVAIQMANVYSKKAFSEKSANKKRLESTNQLNRLLILQEEKLNQFKAIALGIIAETAAEKGLAFQQTSVQDLKTAGDKPDACAILLNQQLSQWWFIFWTKVPQLEDTALMTARDRAAMLMGRLVTMEPDSRRKISIVVDDADVAEELRKMKGTNSFKGNLTVILINKKKVRIINENVISTYENVCGEFLIIG